jgi:hypothetical protein
VVLAVLLQPLAQLHLRYLLVWGAWQLLLLLL